jgi:hypothetical protein
VDWLSLERKAKNKRGFIGYNQNEVRNNIQSLQDQHQKNLEELNQMIIAEKEKNQRLIVELESLKQQSVKNSIAEEVMKDLNQQFIQQTEAISQLKVDYEEKERILKEKLEQKIKQKEFAQLSMMDILEYLNNQKNELKKELIK